MRAIRFENARNADVIKLVEEPIPQPRPHDLLVRAAGLDRADILQRQGFALPQDGRASDHPEHGHAHRCHGIQLDKPQAEVIDGARQGVDRPGIGERTQFDLKRFLITGS